MLFTSDLAARKRRKKLPTKKAKKNDEILRKAIIQNSPSTHIKLIVEEGAKHEFSAWANRLPGALQFLFNPNNK